MQRYFQHRTKESQKYGRLLCKEINGEIADIFYKSASCMSDFET